MRQLGLAATETYQHPPLSPPAAEPAQASGTSARQVPQEFPASFLHSPGLTGQTSCAVWSPLLLALLTPSPQAGWAKRPKVSFSDPTTAPCLFSGGAGLPGCPPASHPCPNQQASRPFPADVASEGSEAWSRRPRMIWWPDGPAAKDTRAPPKPRLPSLRARCGLMGCCPEGLQCPKREGTPPR